MFAGLMWSPSSQQRRLLSGQKHISFSGEPGLFSAHATAAEGGGRRRRRQAEPGQQQQQQSKQQSQDQRHADDCIPKKSTIRSRSRRTGTQARDQLLQQSASAGVLRAADLEGRQQQVHHSNTQLPWSPQPVHKSTSKRDSSNLPSSPASSSASAASDSSSLSSSIPSTSERQQQSSDAGNGTYSSSSSSSSSDGSSVSYEDSSSSRSSFMQLTEDEEAIIAATNRISRFMDFRERCASEVVTKLTEVGYDKQFAHKVVKRMQETGQQDDARFAEMFVRGQWMAKSSAPSRIAYELRVRGVAQEHIDAALTVVFGDSKQISGREPSDDSQEVAWRKLVEVCRQRVETTHMYPQQKRRAKLATWLQRRGHSLATAFRMFEELGI